MGIEIERKFLVAGSAWQQLPVSEVWDLEQFYLCCRDEASIRVRIRAGRSAWLTVKSASVGPRRSELEYTIPLEDANDMKTLAQGSIIEKRRHILDLDGIRWEIDVFTGDNSGLVLAEVELSAEDQSLAVPQWIGREVTDDLRYQNASLALRPFATWATGR